MSMRVLKAQVTGLLAGLTLVDIAAHSTQNLSGKMTFGLKQLCDKVLEASGLDVQKEEMIRIVRVASKDMLEYLFKEKNVKLDARNRSDLISHALRRNNVEAIQTLLSLDGVNRISTAEPLSGNIPNVVFVALRMLDASPNKQTFVVNLYERFRSDGGDATTNDAFSNNLLHVAVYEDHQLLAERLSREEPALLRQANKAKKLPGDYCLDQSWCRSYPRSDFNTSMVANAFGSSEILKDFPQLRIEQLMKDLTAYKKFDTIKIIGEGGFGRVSKIVINGKALSLKQQHPCTNTENDERIPNHLQLICRDMKRVLSTGDVYAIKKINDVDVELVTNNMILEVLVSLVINDIIDKMKTINFVKTEKMFLLRTAQMMTFMEYCDGDLTHLPQILKRDLNDDDYINVLTQITYAIDLLHVHKIRHNDIHAKNFLVKRIRSPFTPRENGAIEASDIHGVPAEQVENMTFVIDSVPVRIPNLGYIVKLIDFGLSMIDLTVRLPNGKTKTHRVRPVYDLKISGTRYYEFNPKVDVLGLINTIINDRDDNDLLLLRRWGRARFQPVVQRIRDAIGLQRDASYGSPSHPHRTTWDVLSKVAVPNLVIIARALKAEAAKSLKRGPASSTTKDLSFYVLKDYYDTAGKPFAFHDAIGAPDLTKLTPISDNISVGTFAMGNQALDNGYVLPHRQYVQVALIKDYRRRTLTNECCNISGMKFLNQNEIRTAKSGFCAINGGFFDIKKTFRPIGLYSDKSIVDDIKKNFAEYMANQYKVPKLYEKYYYVLQIDEATGVIDFLPFTDMIKQVEQNPSILDGKRLLLSVAPMLYSTRTNVRVTDTMNKAAKEHPNIFDCDPTVDPIGKMTMDGNYSCKTISPGELSHGNQPNPRSCLMVKGNDLIFLTCEGRNERGYGLTFADLQSIAEHLKVDEAINLDGGRSSHIAFKPKDVTGVYCLNPVYQEFTFQPNMLEKYYAVGNIFVVRD